MNRTAAEVTVVHCMNCYLRGIRRECPYDYYRKMKGEVLEAAREVVDVYCYKTLEKLIEEMEAEEMEAEENA